MTWTEFAGAYCERQEQTPEELYKVLLGQSVKWQPDGWMLLQCQMLDSSFIGQLTILPYGPNNTYKTVPDHPVSPRGLASDMSTVVGILTAEEFHSNKG